MGQQQKWDATALEIKNLLGEESEVQRYFRSIVAGHEDIKERITLAERNNEFYAVIDADYRRDFDEIAQMQNSSEMAQMYRSMSIVHRMYYFGISFDADVRSLQHIWLLIRFIREKMIEHDKTHHEVMVMIVNNIIESSLEFRTLTNLLLEGKTLTVVCFQYPELKIPRNLALDIESTANAVRKQLKTADAIINSNIGRRTNFRTAKSEVNVFVRCMHLLQTI